MKVIVTNIQRFCLHDGPGIRTTVFFKGCNLICPWCANPENIEFDIEKHNYECKEIIYGYEITLADLEEEILKDEVFYGNGGGVTFSGGEALLQFKKIEPLLQNLKRTNINICLETALCVPEDLVDIAIKYVDEFIIDIKTLEDENANEIKSNLKYYRKNIEKIFLNNKKVVFRLPLVKDYIVTDNNMNLILDFLARYKPYKLEIFRIHNLAEKKYRTLNKNMYRAKEITDEEIKDIKSKIEKLGINVQLCKI